MGNLVIDAAARAAAAEAIVRAKANPVSLADIKASAAPHQERAVIDLKDREGAALERERFELQLGDYRAAVSFEYQPPGLCCHISMSSKDVGTVPNNHAIRAMVELFGFGDDEPVSRWLEEFAPGHHAVNFLMLCPTVQ